MRNFSDTLIPATPGSAIFYFVDVETVVRDLLATQFAMLALIVYMIYALFMNRWTKKEESMRHFVCILGICVCGCIAFFLFLLAMLALALDLALVTIMTGLAGIVMSGVCGLLWDYRKETREIQVRNIAAAELFKGSPMPKSGLLDPKFKEWFIGK